MEVIRTEQPEWLTNSYLVYDEPGGTGVLIDANGQTKDLLGQADELGLEVTHLVLTHEHWDHVVDAAEVASDRDLKIVGHPELGTALELPIEAIGDGEILRTGGLEIEAIASPGHCDSHLAFLVNGSDLFSGDSLFAGTVGGTMLPGRTGLEEMKAAIMDRLMKLPAETTVHPGHSGPTTIGTELEENPFVRLWSGRDDPGEEPCEVTGFGEATLLLWAPDYDGTNKALVRFEDGRTGIVGGSMVERPGA
jgi:hydroxyacylglutathione hydrolase